MDLSTVTVNTAPIFTLAVTVIGALVGLLAVRKAVKLANRS
jgi:F0F1-type ATP synthase assembly protein I